MSHGSVPTQQPVTAEDIRRSQNSNMAANFMRTMLAHDEMEVRAILAEQRVKELEAEVARLRGSFVPRLIEPTKVA